MSLDTTINRPKLGLKSNSPAFCILHFEMSEAEHSSLLVATCPILEQSKFISSFILVQRSKICHFRKQDGADSVFVSFLYS